MLVKFVEIYEENMNFSSSTPKKDYVIREVYINRNHIVCIKEDFYMLNNFIQSKILKEFPKNQKFSLLSLNRGNSGYDISVLGSPEYIYQIVENTNGAKT